MFNRKKTLRQRARRRIAAVKSDIRGVALQTVIVIVVLLVIAGGVSAVLLSRSSDVVGQLESQGIGLVTEGNCPIISIGGENGKVFTATNAAVGPVAQNAKGCIWQLGADRGAAIAEASDAQCFASSGGQIVADIALANVQIGGMAMTGDDSGCVTKIA